MKESYLAADFKKTVSRQFPQRAKELESAFEARLQKLRRENAGASKEKQRHL